MTDRTENSLLEEPFFIVGPLRSGTTLLRLLVDHHPQINCFGEFEGAVSQAVGSQWPAMETYHNFVLHDRQTQAYGFTVDKTLDYVSLVKSFLAQLYARDPGKIIGASVHSRMDMLPRIWPEARFIHLLRDPRDVARSCIGMGWVGNVHEGAQYWQKPEEHWDLLARTVDASRRMVVRFEDLVVDPEKELGRICEFLGLQYDPVMLDIDKDTTYSPPSLKFAGQWQDKLSAKEIAWVEYQCKDLMHDRGYPLATPDPRAPSRLDRFKIFLQNRLFRIRFNVKRYGLSNWLLYVISKRLGYTPLRNRVQQRINLIDVKYLK